jgi:hypothetical protein
MSQGTEGEKPASVLPQIVAAVIIALVAGGTSPWWWDKLVVWKQWKHRK